jgi:hypothetical protein
VSDPKPSIGRTVHYRLSAKDAEQINRRRTNGASIHERMQTTPPQWPSGAQAHIGNTAYEGDVVPLTIVRVWDNNLVNGQALLDGNDQFWVTSAHQAATSDETGVWFWPPRV